MEQLFAAMPKLLKELGENHAVTEQMVFAAWRSVAGEMLRNRTQPLEFFERRLVVAVEDETWRRNLETLAPEMVAKLNSATEQGTVHFIEFRIDKKAVRPVRAMTEIRSQDLPDPLLDAANAIRDERLRKTFLDAAAAYLNR